MGRSTLIVDSPQALMREQSHPTIASLDVTLRRILQTRPENRAVFSVS